VLVKLTHLSSEAETIEGVSNLGLNTSCC